MRIGNFVFFERVTPKITATDVEKKDSTWGKLWLTIQENRLFANKVTQPYKQVSSVYKAIKAICDNVPQAEPSIYTWEDDTEIDNRNNDYVALFLSPNEEQSGSDFFQELVGFHCLYGESFIVKQATIGTEAGTKAVPNSLRAYSPNLMQEKKDSNGNLTGWLYDNKELLLKESVIHIKDFNPYDKIRGLSPIDSIRMELDLDYYAMIFNSAFFINDATPNFILSTDKNLTEEQRERITKWFEKKHQGADKKHKMSVFEGGLKPEILAQTHKDMEFLEQRRYSREEMLGTWRAPKALFNITEDLNYATFQGQMKIFWLYAIMPILRKVEDAINRHLIKDPKLYFAFDIKNVPAFQEDFAQKIATAKTLWDMGFTANEINQKLDLGFDEEDWRDYWWIGFGQVPADVEASRAFGEDETPNDEEGSEKQVSGKQDKMPFDMEAWATWKTFLTRQAPLERLMQKKISRFFYEQRVRLLKLLNQNNFANVVDLLNWADEDERLKKLVLPLITESVEKGVDMGKRNAGQKGEMDLSVKLQAYIMDRTAKIVGLNTTTRKKLRVSIDNAIKAGQTISDIQDIIKDNYNLSSSRAMMIARTETVGAVNGGSILYYQEVGVPFKRWVTAGDELVRKSHQRAEAEGKVPIGDTFSNGCRYAGDQECGEAGEVVNCRCTVVPVLQ